LSGLANKFKENLSLKTLMPQLIETLKSGEGINVIESEVKGADLFSAFDEVDLDEATDEEDEEDLEDESEDSDREDDGSAGCYNEDAEKMVVENEYVSEKISALFCLQELSKFQNPQLFDFYTQCFNELKNLSYLSHNNIKKESYLGIAYLISYYHNFCVANLHQANDAQKEQILKSNLDIFSLFVTISGNF
jgi:hypothetical protein